MKESSKKIRVDFLKGLGIMNPCPSDMEYIAPIPDIQLLKSLVKRSLGTKSGPGMYVKKYDIPRYTISSVLRAIKK